MQNAECTVHSAFSISWVIPRPRCCPGSAPRNPLHRFPSAAHEAVARDHRLGIAAARRREAAPRAGPIGQRRERALVDVNPADGQPLAFQQRDGQRHEHDHSGPSRHSLISRGAPPIHCGRGPTLGRSRRRVRSGSGSRLSLADVSRAARSRVRAGVAAGANVRRTR